MLFKQIHLQGIKAGEISIVFRKWIKPRVNKGTLVKTSVGRVEILNINKIDLKNITTKDAIAAGHKDLEAVTKNLTSRKEGDIYKIMVAYHSPDPRIKLRKQTELSEVAFDQIKIKLKKFDKFSRQGDWTLSVLQAIHDYPKLRAQDLSAQIGKQKDWLKPNVRKLKNLGLTISHHPGYILSPRGEIVLEKLTHKKL